MAAEETHKCDYCEAMATHDTKTKKGYWAYVCDSHLEEHGASWPPPTNFKELAERRDELKRKREQRKAKYHG